MPKVWTEDRWDELDLLEQLVRQVSSINNSTGCLERIAGCIEMAKRLDRTGRNMRRDSFLAWLKQMAREESEADRAK